MPNTRPQRVRSDARESHDDLPFDANARPVWEIIEEIGATVPAQEWQKSPSDAARNLRHYLYGHAKQRR